MCVHHRARVQVQWSPNECARGFLEDKVCLTNVILQTLSRLPAEPKWFLFTRQARGYLQQRPRFYKADSTPDGCACRDVPALPVGDWHHLLVPDHLVKDTVLSSRSKQVSCSILLQSAEGSHVIICNQFIRHTCCINIPYGYQSVYTCRFIITFPSVHV